MRRVELDAAVERVLQRARRSVSADDVAERLGISRMSAWYSLQRLSDRGIAMSSVELVDTPYRIRNTIKLYTRLGMRVGSWPAWLCPAALPAVVGRTVVKGSWS